MKNLVIIVSLILFGCNHKVQDISDNTEMTKQQMAEEAVKTYLAKTLDDPKSYEAVKFDTLELFDSLKNLNRLLSSLKQDSSDYGYTSEEMREEEGKMESINKEVSAKLKNCYRIRHQFRAKNKMGALILSDEETFFLDTALHVFVPEY